MFIDEVKILVRLATAATVVSRSGVKSSFPVVAPRVATVAAAATSI